MVLPNGGTALMIAALLGHAEVIEALLELVPNPQQLAQLPNLGGYTALIISASRGHTRVITALLDGVENPEALTLQTNMAGQSALRLAIRQNRREAAFALVQGVQNPIEMLTLEGPDQLTTLQFAIQSGFSGLREAAGLEKIHISE
jgi:ankyrin repeat protein